jgi:class 3 adenylate cyclase
VAQSRSRLARLILMLMMTVAAVVFVYLFMSLAARFTDSGRQKDFAAVALNQFFEVVDMEQRAKAEQAEDWDELLNQYSDTLVHEMEDLGKSSMPIVEAAFRDQMRKDMGKHRAMFNEQRDLLVSNLQEQGDALLQARYQKILDQHKTILREEFEDLDDEKMERMLVHFNVAMERLLKKYYIDEIESQMNRLRGTFDEFAVGEPPSSGETLNQQLLGTSVELLTVKFVGDPIVVIDGDDVSAEGDESEAASTDAPDEKEDGATETTEKEPADDGKPDSE